MISHRAFSVTRGGSAPTRTRSSSPGSSESSRGAWLAPPETAVLHASRSTMRFSNVSPLCPPPLARRISRICSTSWPSPSSSMDCPWLPMRRMSIRSVVGLHLARVWLELTLVPLKVVVDFREALEELHGTKSAPKLRRNTDEHTFLILDKHLHAFPWESLPCLRGRSISRLPSTSFLRDRLDLAASRGQQDPLNIFFNPRRAAYILNPGNDLKHTQLTFEPWLKERSRACGWSGVVGRVPLEEEVRGALTNQDLLLCVPCTLPAHCLPRPADRRYGPLSQVLRSRWCRAVHPLADGSKPLAVCCGDALGLLVRHAEGAGGL